MTDDSHGLQLDRDGDASGPGSASVDPSGGRPLCSIYVKQQGDMVFTPIHLRTKTMSELIHQLRKTFPDALPEQCTVGQLLQQTRGSLMFHVDDEIVDAFKSRQVFEIRMKGGGGEADDRKTVDITLIELEMT